MAKIGIQTQLDNLRSIRYTSRDFLETKNELNQYLLTYFPNSGSDFSEGSGSQVLIELFAYVADILNFYIDKSFNEQFLTRVVERKNAYDLSFGLGRQPKQITPSVADVTFTFSLPVTGSTTSQFFFNISKGSRFKSSKLDVVFENIEPIIFNKETARNWQSTVTTKNVRGSSVLVREFSLSGLKVVSGITKTFKKNIGSPSTFQKVHIQDTNINQIQSVFDSEGNQWYEVKNLSQEFIFTGVPNLDAAVNDPTYLLTVKRVPRRYVVNYEPDGSATMTFGSGEVDLSDSEIILSPENLMFPNKTIGKFLDFNPDSIQLNDFLNTTSLGVAPKNTTLIIKYRTGGGIQDNIGSGLINKIENADVQFYSLNLDAITRQFVVDTMTVTNPEPTQGGEEPETIDQIKVNASYWYASQDRVVSIQDYIARACSMPPQYGSIYKVFAQHTKNQSLDNIDRLTDRVQRLVSQRNAGVEDQVLVNEIKLLNEGIKNTASDVKMFVVCRDNNGYLQKPTNTLKKNLRTYLNQFKVASDTLEIEDVKIINIGCNFVLHTDVRNINPSEVLLNSMNLLQSYLSLSNMEIGKDINIDDIRKELMGVKGVISIPSINFFTIHGNVDGRSYSTDYNFPITDFLNYNSTILECPFDGIFECRHPKSDIEGRFVD